VLPVAGKSLPLRDGRSLPSYLVIPRPDELLIKTMFISIAGLTSRLVDRVPQFAWHDLIATIIIFEFFIYQARYILNDLAGASADAHYPGRKSATRFPVDLTGVPRSRDVRISLAFVFVRLILGALLGVTLLSGTLRSAFIFASAAALGVGVVYDRLRSLRPTESTSFTMTWQKRAILLVVGLGYSIRVCLGWVAGAPHDVSSLKICLLSLTFATFGALFVAMTFSLDGLALLNSVPRTLVAGGHVRLALAPGEALKFYGHKGPLLADLAGGSESRSVSVSFTSASREQVPLGPLLRGESGLIASDRVGSLSSWRPLLGVRTLRSWVNELFGVSIVLSSITGPVLVGSPFISSLLMGVLVLPVALAMVKIPARLLSVLPSLIAVVFLLCTGYEDMSLVEGALLPLVVAGTYVIFRGFRFVDIEASAVNLVFGGLRQLATWLVVMCVSVLAGRQVGELLLSDRPRHLICAERLADGSELGVSGSGAKTSG
jgi:hypothetical protein